MKYLMLLAVLLCACATPPIIKTVHIEVPVEKIVAVPDELTKPVPLAEVPTPLTCTGSGLLNIDQKCRLILANCQLEKIAGLTAEPVETPWCKKFRTKCADDP